MEETVPAPKFTKHLQNMGERMEGSSIKLEAQITPSSDSSMNIEWYKDGQLQDRHHLQLRLRLNISGLRAEDAGTYICRAVSRLSRLELWDSLGREVSVSASRGGLGLVTVTAWLIILEVRSQQPIKAAGDDRHHSSPSTILLPTNCLLPTVYCHYFNHPGSQVSAASTGCRRQTPTE